MSLTCERLNYQVGDTTLLNLPNVEFERGKISVIQGPSGAGKSTLLYCLAGIDIATGTIALDNTPMSLTDEQSRDRYRRQNIGLIFQNIHLLPGLSILENVLLPLSFEQWSPTKQQLAHATTLLSSFGFRNFNDKTDFLSRGEKQRIAIARALVTKPSVLLADEPTASLDASNSLQVIELLRQFADENQIVIVTSHDPIVLSAADTVYALERGRLV